MSAAVVLMVPRMWAAGQVVRRSSDGRIGPVSVRPEPRLPRVSRGSEHRLRLVRAQAEEAPTAPPRPELAFYRKYTEAMLRRYVRFSMESGRTPSLLGRELFRGKVTNYKVRAFDDVVIFVHDVGKCLATLGMGQQHLIRRIALEGHTQGEAAALSGLSLSTVIRGYNDAVDELTSLFLEKKMMEPNENISQKLSRGSDPK